MNTALIVVDMQHYYLSDQSDFYNYHEKMNPTSMHYIHTRCKYIVVPHIRRLITSFRNSAQPVFFLRLCGKSENRRDLHRYFSLAHHHAVESGFSNLYPLATHPDSRITNSITPEPQDAVIDKTTFSPFVSTGMINLLHRHNADILVFTGLATSQCVETSARDASDRGFGIIHIEDAQADYSEDSHYASLYSSQSVCGGWIYSTNEFLNNQEAIVHEIHAHENMDNEHTP